MLVLIAFMTAHVTATGRTEIRIAANLAANAAAQAAADGGVYQAIFNLADPRPERRWALVNRPTSPWTLPRQTASGGAR